MVSVVPMLSDRISSPSVAHSALLSLPLQLIDLKSSPCCKNQQRTVECAGMAKWRERGDQSGIHKINDILQL